MHSITLSGGGADFARVALLGAALPLLPLAVLVFALVTLLDMPPLRGSAFDWKNEKKSVSAGWMARALPHPLLRTMKRPGDSRYAVWSTRNSQSKQRVSNIIEVAFSSVMYVLFLFKKCGVITLLFSFTYEV